jgi:hypothetical protein
LVEQAVILLSHPTGNAFVRALLIGLVEAGKLDSFHTTLSFGELGALAPSILKHTLLRRQFPVPASKIHQSPIRELVRLTAPKLRLGFLTKHEVGWASIDAVYKELDRQVSNHLLRRESHASLPQAIYSYEDACLASFKTAKNLNMQCFYDLPIAFWQTSRRLLDEEAQRWPNWEPTLYGTRDSTEKHARKAEEIELADAVICPSKFVLETLPEEVRRKKVQNYLSQT